MSDMSVPLRSGLEVWPLPRMQTGELAEVFPGLAPMSRGWPRLDADSGISGTSWRSTLTTRGITTERRFAGLRKAVDARVRELQAELRLKIRTRNAAADLQRDLAIALIEMKVEAFRGVRDVLARRARGIHGLCAQCGAGIPFERRRAHPLALRCRECEEECERSERRSRRTTRAGSSPRFDGLVALVRRAFALALRRRE